MAAAARALSTAPSPTVRPARIPAFDSLRGLSILLVMLDHVTQRRLGPIGWFAVVVFLVTSGYLITWVLLQEEEKGRVSLKRFYQRRIWRLAPAWLCFIGAVAILDRVGYLDLPPDNWLYVLTYTVNWNPHGVWWTGHLWSLAVQEQFYILWPPVIALCSPRVRLRVLWIVIGACPLLRAGALYLTPQWYDSHRQAFPLVADGLAWGCLLAIRPVRLRWALWLIPVVAASAAMHSHPRFAASVGETIVYAGLGLVIVGLIERGWESKPLLWVGTISYSLYLWQQLFLDPYHRNLATTLPYNLGFALLAAMASYHWIECPFRQYRGEAFGIVLSVPRRIFAWFGDASECPRCKLPLQAGTYNTLECPRCRREY